MRSRRHVACKNDCSPFPTFCVTSLWIDFYTLPLYSGGVLWFSCWTSIHLSVVSPSVCLSFPDDNLSKHQWILTKLGMCIDIVEIWFGIANGQISSNLRELSAQDTPIFSFPDDNLSKCQWIFTKLGMCIDIVEIWIGIANGQISSNFDGVVKVWHCLTFLFFHTILVCALTR